MGIFGGVLGVLADLGLMWVMTASVEFINGKSSETINGWGAVGRRCPGTKALRRVGCQQSLPGGGIWWPSSQRRISASPPTQPSACPWPSSRTWPESTVSRRMAPCAVKGWSGW